MDAKDRALYDEKLRNLEIRAQEWQISSLEHIRELVHRVGELERWRASLTASNTRNALIIGAGAIIGSIITALVAYLLRGLH